MTTPRDQPGFALTRDDIHQAQAALGDDPERLDPAEQPQDEPQQG